MALWLVGPPAHAIHHLHALVSHRPGLLVLVQRPLQGRLAGLHARALLCGGNRAPNRAAGTALSRMAQPRMGAGVLHAYGADRRSRVGDRLRSDGSSALRRMAAVETPRRCCSPRACRVGLVAAVASAAVLRLLRGLRLCADLHPTTVAALVLQRALWHGDVTGARNLRCVRGRAARSLAARADGWMGARMRPLLAARGDDALRRQLYRDDVPHPAGTQRGYGQRNHAYSV